jgi:hypothetical protein
MSPPQELPVAGFSFLVLLAQESSMTSRLKNYIAVVLDRSGSMYSVQKETIEAFNSQVDKIRSETDDQHTTISLFTFASNAHVDFFNAELANLKPLTTRQYNPGGMTALFDGVGLAIEMFKAVPDANQDHVSFLVIVITDGGENSSTKYSRDAGGAEKIVQLLRETQLTDRWTFAFLMPPGTGRAFAETYGIPTDNIREWSATREGVREASVATQSGIGHYFSARKMGKKSVAAFYHTTDLSGIDRKTLHAKLTDISPYFKVYEVPKECRIDEFVAEKSKRPYIVGSGYYQLMKRETIQTHKKILIMEKGQKAIWGGPEARDLIGLPEGAESKVTPGNHANYDIFVQSKAPNRKLVRGTKLIYDPSHTSEADATWDYKTAYEEAEKKRAAAATT